MPGGNSQPVSVGFPSDFSGFLHFGDSQATPFCDSCAAVKRFKRYLEIMRAACERMPNRRTGKNPTYRVGDIGMAAFDCFFMQSPYFLACQHMLDNRCCNNLLAFARHTACDLAERAWQDARPAAGTGCSGSCRCSLAGWSLRPVYNCSMSSLTRSRSLRSPVPGNPCREFKPT